MALKAVIFDLDETLLDSSALRDARNRRDWAEVFNGFDRVSPFAVEAGEVPVASLPAEMKRRGLGVGLVTDSPGRYASELMRLHGIRVDAMVSGSDGYAPKPFPSGLLAVMADLGVSPDECLLVGDSVGDFGAAADAGMLSVGVSWTKKTPASWKLVWPDVSVAHPSQLLALVDGAVGLGPVGEEVAAGVVPTAHFGSVMRLGGNAFGLGRYFSMGDRRRPGHELSRLIIDSKGDEAASEKLAEVFGALTRLPMSNPPEAIVSVPPAPGDDRDRFDRARAVLAEAYGAVDAGGALRQLYGVATYKSTSRADRPGYVVNRFEAVRSFQGERAVLLDDVFTSGAQSGACRDALLAAGCGSVSIIVSSVTQDKFMADLCPWCGELGGRQRVQRRHRDGKEFLACTRYRSAGCTWTANLSS